MTIPRLLTDRLSRGIRLPLQDKWLWLKMGTVLLSVALLAVLWSFSLLRLNHEQRMAIEQASVSQRNLAQIVVENLRQVLDRGSQYALLLGKARTSGEPLTGFGLPTMLVGDRAYNRAALFDLRGRQTQTSAPAPLPHDLKSALDELARQGRSGMTASVTVGPLSQNYGELWQVPLMLGVIDADGRPTGILLLHLDLGYLLRLYQDIDIGASGIIQVSTDRGVELARASSRGLEIGKPLSPTEPPVGKLPRETRIAELPGESHPHLVSHNYIAAYPLAVSISQDLSEILGEFELRKSKYMLSLIVASMIILLMTATLIGAMRRQRLLFDAIAASEQDKLELIDLLEEEKRHAYELAAHDHLTGLANRRMFMTLAASHLARAQRSRQYYALMFVDLDRFKSINDSLGHKVGDLLLQRVAQRLQDNLRESDIIARFGGDEFVILITGVEQQQDVATIARKLVTAICAPYANLDGHDLQMGPSIGIAVFPSDGDDVETLIRHADLAMYQSKKAGRGCFTFYDAAMNVKSANHFDLEQRLLHAVGSEEFVLHYQPKLDLESHCVVGFEALIRWQHPEYGLIFPNDFIPMAEASGHIVDLGNWVIRAACKQLAAWRDLGLDPLPVAINLSGRQLSDPELARRMIATVREYALYPSLLQVEVTESSLVENIEQASGLLNELVAAGIKIALDDFGNGFSSLSYIKTLPISHIKIDRGFVHDILNSHDDSVIVLSTISLAHNLGMRVTAEGVETRAQLIHLRTGGCDEVQGYFLSRPLPATEVQGIIAHPRRSLA